MVPCKHCHTPNSLDSTFCKRCGTAIAEDELRDARAKLEKLIEEGNSLFNQGRTDEALAIAEAAVTADPSNSSAFSLKVLCHERRGEIALALEAADRLVELNPDSDFDKIRRTVLRQKLQTDLLAPSGPDRRLAFVGAVAAVLFVVSVGAFAARVTANAPTADNRNASIASTPTPSQPASAPPANAAPNTVGSPTNPSNSSNSTQAASSQQTPAGQGSQATQTGLPLNPNRTDGDSGERQAKYVRPETDDNSLPTPVSDNNVVVQPFTPKLPAAAPAPSASASQADSSDEPPAFTSDKKPATTSPTTTPSPATTSDPGQISIVVRSGSSTPRRASAGGSDPIGGNGLASLVRVGSQQFQLGNYAGAARSYEQAVQSGGDGIVLNRRLAQAYERLGRTSDAAEAYRKCISSIDAALAAGRGNRESLTSTRDVCVQALKVLGG